MYTVIESLWAMDLIIANSLVFFSEVLNDKLLSAL